MSPEFWQRLLAAEIPPNRCRDLLRDLGPSFSGDPDTAIACSSALRAEEKRRFQDADAAIVQEMVTQGVHVLERSNFPQPLAESPHAPPVLFAWGDSACLQEPCVAIVGTRAATTYGKAVAQKFAESLALAGVTIVSGGALGIDAAAHKGALAVGGRTAAVLITGIERVYPRVHHGLFQDIKRSGCLLSQFAIGLDGARDYRPLIRNQTVAAMSQAVIVIEAPERSGSLSTAHAANELGRQVFVVPANIENLNFKGSHALIRDGATLVDHPDQVLEALHIAPALQLQLQANGLSPTQDRILSVLSTSPLASEFIVERTGLDTSEVLSELTILELDGRVIRDAGGYAVKL